MNYTKEPGYLYIETAEDKAKHAPKLATDEIWVISKNLWISCGGEYFSDQFNGADCNVYRRKIQVEGGWIECATCLPEMGKDVWVCDEDRNTFPAYNADPVDFKKSRITHWQPIVRPTPPAPKVSDEEKACQKAWRESNLVGGELSAIFNAGFLAGIEFQKGRR